MTHKHNYFLYILYSKKVDRYYTGTSDNPEKRLHYHNIQDKGWTRRGRPWELVFNKGFESKREARKWERWLKQQKNRRIIEKIIRGEFKWEV